MAQEKFECGCEVTFGTAGDVRAVTCCERHDHVFTEHKSLRQISMDLHHEITAEKHRPKPEPKLEPPPESPAAPPTV